MLGKTVEVDLIPDGRNIDVNDQNKKDYVKARVNYKMTEEIKTQIECFIQGFYDIVPYKALKILSV